MPDVLIEVRGDWLKDRKVNFIEAVEDGIVAALQTPKDDKILRLTTRLGARVVAPKQYWRSQPREYKDLFDGTRFGQR